ncbi:signal peptide peptidase SppA [Candidatus Woesearchaeota archaeon]|jgi:protease-4|nr:signal peptide peptidase SppA [Candidatus Woesearchaeota archaeon]
MKKKQIQQADGRGRWGVVIVVLIFLALISFISALIVGVFVSTSEIEPAGNVAHIKVTGPIVVSAQRGFMSTGMTDSTEIVRLIEKADENPDIKALLIEINSPGGTAVASYEVADAILKANKTTVAWIREGGVSGAYWAATATDHIVANPMSVTGSIGVIASYLEFSGTLERYNASYQRLVSGPYKDIGSPFKKMTVDEEQIMQQNIDQIRVIFVEEIAKNRDLPVSEVEELADGRFFLGKQAIELGLVDELGGKDEAVAWIEEREDIEAELAEYKRPKSLGEILFEAFSEHGFYMGLGFGESMSVEKGVGITT